LSFICSFDNNFPTDWHYRTWDIFSKCTKGNWKKTPCLYFGCIGRFLLTFF
jgi:hypothetical protein